MTARVRAFVALGGVLFTSAVLVLGVLGLLLPSQAAPSLSEKPAVAPALTHRFLFVIVDGLRYDFGTDPSKMPQFSRAMREEASGELWAVRVSTTTSAILTIATGQRATFEQIVFNAFPRPPPYDSWIAEAKHAGKSVMCAGDPAWTQMFGAHIDERRLDPKGVAMDVDFNPETFRNARELRAKNPDLLIVHFTTPDHQAHTYTVPSARYAAHMRQFDRDLFEFLSELGPEWTMIVAGDHGASDSGTHGTDVPIQRRTVVWGRGPGIRRGSHSPPKIDQADLAGTISALIGVPAPTHSRGKILADWLDTTPEAREQIACANARRALELVGKNPNVSCSLASASQIVENVDEKLESESGHGGGGPRWLALAVTLLGLLTAFVALRDLERKTLWRGLAGSVLIGGLGVFLTWGVERLPGSGPLAARIAFFAIGNVPALLILLAPGTMARLAERAPVLSALVVPGWLLATYTTNAQPEAYAALVVGLVLIVALGGLEVTRPTLRASSRVLGNAALVSLGLAALVLFFPGTRLAEIYPIWLRRDPTNAFVLAIVALLLLALGMAAYSKHADRVRIGLVGAFTIVAALVARRLIAPIPGRLAIAAGLTATLVFALRRRRLAALFAGLFTYAWISRDIEIVPLAATIWVADGAGRALAAHHDEHRALSYPTLLVATLFLFGLAFVQRIGLQGAIDFGAMDWGVAGFGDRHVPAWIVGVALGTKYALGVALAIGVSVSWLASRARLALLRAVFLAFLARAVVLGAMFLLAGESFWTGTRVLGDIPFALIWAVTAGLLWAFAELGEAPGYGDLAASRSSSSWSRIWLARSSGSPNHSAS